MTAKKISELTEKTPVSTDVIPVADPVTGIAGKSTISQVVAAVGSTLPAITSTAFSGYHVVTNQSGTAYQIVDQNPSDILSYIPTTGTSVNLNGFIISNRFGIGGGAAYTSLTNLNINDLTIIPSQSTAAFQINNFPVLQYVDIFSLHTVNGGVLVAGNQLVQVQFRALTYVDRLIVQSCPLLTTLVISSLLYCNSDFTIQDCPSLTTFAFNFSRFKGIGGIVTLTGNAFTQTTVDDVLVRLAFMDGTNGKFLYSNNSVNISGGTNSPPSATGLAAKATLVSRGCTVTHN